MTTKPTTETDAADNETGTEKDPNSETTTDEKTEPETGSDSEESGSNVTPREKFLRGKLRDTEKELESFRKAEEDRRRAEMTEAEKLREEIAEKDSKLGKLLRKSIAAEHGLDAEFAERLQGVTEEELTEDAKRLAALVVPKKPTIPKPEDVGIGVPGSTEGESDPVKAHRAAMARRRF